MDHDRLKLDYRPPPRERVGALSIGPPMSWRCAVAMVVLWTWPFLGTLASVDALYMRPAFHLLGFFVLAWVVLLAYAMRAIALNREREPLTLDAQRVAWRRVAAVVVASAGVTTLHATALPLRLIFLAHLPAFERARGEAEATLPPGGVAPRGRVGLFSVVRVQRGTMGGVAFNLDSESGIEFGDETLIPPTGGEGRLSNGWRWVITD